MVAVQRWSRVDRVRPARHRLPPTDRARIPRRRVANSAAAAGRSWFAIDPGRLTVRRSILNSTDGVRSGAAEHGPGEICGRGPSQCS